MAEQGTAPARTTPTCSAIARTALGEPRRKAGDELFYPCPNHNDQKPSLQINTRKNCWICGPCRQDGGPWDLIHFLGGPEPSDKRGLARWFEKYGLGQSQIKARSCLVAAYSYTDEGGKELFQQLRYEPKDFKVRHIGPDGKSIWGKRGVRLVPYNLPEVLRSDEVYITEGEKDADSLKRWGLAATTNPFGAGKWRPEFNLHFRDKLIRILPDNDPPGEAHALDVARQLLAVAREVKIVHLPGVAKKGDVTEWQAAGGSKEKLLTLVTDAPVISEEMLPTAEEGGAAPWTKLAAKNAGPSRRSRSTGPYQFELRSSGVYCLNPGANQKELWICSPLEVTGRTVDKNGTAWGVFIRFSDPKGTLHQFPIPSRLFAGDGNEYRGFLLDAGLMISPTRQAREMLSHYLQTQATQRFIRVVTKLGWDGDHFVLPPSTCSGEGPAPLLYQPSSAGECYLCTAGTLDEWTRSVAKLCRGNSRLVFAASCGFAGPLLARIDADCSGFHFLGGSSQGKSTALMVGGSVLGGGGRLGFCRTWRSTVNGLEAIAEGHNDQTLFLDELNQANPTEVIDAAYMLANGQGKVRSGKTLLPRPILSWRLLFLSSGEITLAQHAQTAGRQARGGAQVRLINIPADAGAGRGIFEDLHFAASAQEFVKLLHTNSLRYYGTPIRAFLDHLHPNLVAVDHRVRAACQTFMQEYAPVGASGEIYRMAESFAIVAAAGELATDARITGWDKGEATHAAARCFRDALAHRGGPGPADVSVAIDRLRALVTMHGTSRFHLLREAREGDTYQPQDRTVNRAGFRETREDGEQAYYIFRDVFRDEVCQGTDPRAVCAELVERGILMREGRHSTRKVVLPGLGRQRVYTILASQFEAE
jgi:putative DNA primase/helicase